MSAADVLEVATPSWKRKGLRSANDLLDSSATAADDNVDGFAAIVSSDFVAASFTVVVVVLLVFRLTPIVGDLPIC